MKCSFFENRPYIENEYEEAKWIENSGLNRNELSYALKQYIDDELIDLPMPLLRAKAFEFFLEHAQIQINPCSMFADKVNLGIDYRKFAGRDIFEENVYRRYREEILGTYMPEDYQKRNLAENIGIGFADADYWHTLPEWPNVIALGIPGLIERAEQAKRKKELEGTLTDKQIIFYDSVIISYKAILKYMTRLWKEAQNYDLIEFTECLSRLLKGAPQNFYDVLEISLLFLNMAEIGVERVRSFGRIDQMYYPYYKKDLESGTYTADQMKEMLKYFYMKCFAAKRFADQPFAICGLDENGNDATNPLTWILLDVYDELNIPNPKIHVCCHPGMSKELLRKCLKLIRKGTSSICLINGETVVKGYEKIGISREEAIQYVPFGCYEPILIGKEEPMIGASWLNMAKAVEFVFTGGIDMRTGVRFSKETSLDLPTYEAFENAFFEQLKDLIDFTKGNIDKQLQFNMQLNPSPVYSGTLTSCIEKGKDIFDGGTKYHNISIKCCGIATVVDSLLMVKKFVYDDKKLTFEEMKEVLENDWAGHELLRKQIRHCPLKYGNHIAEVDALMNKVYKFVASMLAGTMTAAGGRYRIGCDSITNNIYFGKFMAATPDGRKAGEPFSKNFCASNGMDRNGITAYILSVTSMDTTDFLDGAVLDFILHHTAVEGDEGLDAMQRMIETYFEKGGYAIQGNIVDLATLLAAKREPEKYQTLQVRVCGWNEYFVNMDEDVQNQFIKQLQVVG